MSERSKKLSIEESFEYLDGILEQMEDEDISLEDSFALYEKGMKVLKEASSAIDEVEKKVKLIDEEGKTEDFDE
ncbi:MAG TPA: exodeoxyribonuclease VII small subunit [Lachnospiraceae bacterium]|nr:exodeoxyribonuclease VII small subunit [Lachnospiraceae bacterium]MCR4786089.1 exodeoxyribonuclease VII small subunit [Lachnospiraceae bacterium]HAL31868.1 exodeoxyribonuclease VII small subunit [Lachnospiraceae bacterium]HBB60024.1 exodeoxyribonuclease VII small subunit [Lachnospiraceae bacterium]HCS00618.1 exodeoxyribonuclease VII small subunit [Lachnospiraceae bacterium]